MPFFLGQENKAARGAGDRADKYAGEISVNEPKIRQMDGDNVGKLGGLRKDPLK